MKNMNFKIFILIILIVGFRGFSQTTLSVEQYGNLLSNHQLIPDSATRVKDVNNKLQKFVGSWQAVYNGLNINVFTSLGTKSNAIWEEHDQLILDYKITDATGDVLIDTRIAPWIDLSGKGWYLAPQGNYTLSYGGLSSVCRPDYRWSIVKTSLNSNSNQLTIDDDLGVILYSTGGMYFDDECPNGLDLSKFPVTDDYIIFTRI